MAGDVTDIYIFNKLILTYREKRIVPILIRIVRIRFFQIGG